MAFPPRAILVLIAVVVAALFVKLTVRRKADESTAVLMGSRSYRQPDYSSEEIDVIQPEGSLEDSTNEPVSIEQPAAELLYLWRMYNEEEDTEQKVKWQSQITDLAGHRAHLDVSVDSILLFLLGPERGSSLRKSTLSVVDDQDCLISMVRLFEKYCGSLTTYGVKHSQSIARICKAGVPLPEMEEACQVVCGGHNFRSLPSSGGHSAI